MRLSARFFILAIVLSAGVIFAGTAVRALFYAPETEIPAPEGREEIATPLQYPVRLIVPRLGIDTHVQDVGVTVSGDMATPSNFTDVGWYKYGVAPGGNGSAVIAGHVDNGLGLAGVFKNLGELEEGDDIFVERADGERVHFVVTGKRSYPYTEVPTGVLFNPTGSARLNLITCEGQWVDDEKTYDQRLVVFSRLVE